MYPYIVFDVETPNHYNDRMSAIGITVIENGVIAEEKALLPDPAPEVHLIKCGDSSLDFTVRVWVQTADYWPVNFRMLDQGKRALDQAGISIPYPQVDVHMK